MLRKNIGHSGRLFRLNIGILLLILAYWLNSWIALALALFTFFEAFMSWCIIYQLLGKNECPIPQEKNSKDKS